MLKWDNRRKTLSHAPAAQKTQKHKETTVNGLSEEEIREKCEEGKGKENEKGMRKEKRRMRKETCGADGH